MLLHIHEQKFADLAAFQANTTMFQANTNVSLKNLETRVGQLALTMQNQSKDAFPTDPRKNPKDCMVVTLRSGREIERRKIEGEETGTENKLSSSDLTEETIKEKVQTEQQVEKNN